MSVAAEISIVESCSSIEPECGWTLEVVPPPTFKRTNGNIAGGFALETFRGRSLPSSLTLIRAEWSEAGVSGSNKINRVRS